MICNLGVWVWKPPWPSVPCHGTFNECMRVVVWPLPTVFGKPTGIMAPSAGKCKDFYLSTYFYISRRIIKCCCCFLLEWHRQRAPRSPLDPAPRRDWLSAVWPVARGPSQPPLVKYSLVPLQCLHDRGGPAYATITGVRRGRFTWFMRLEARNPPIAVLPQEQPLRVSERQCWPSCLAAAGRCWGTTGRADSRRTIPFLPVVGRLPVPRMQSQVRSCWRIWLAELCESCPWFNLLLVLLYFDNFRCSNRPRLQIVRQPQKLLASESVVPGDNKSEGNMLYWTE